MADENFVKTVPLENFKDKINLIDGKILHNNLPHKALHKELLLILPGPLIIQRLTQNQTSGSITWNISHGQLCNVKFSVLGLCNLINGTISLSFPKHIPECSLPCKLERWVHLEKRFLLQISVCEKIMRKL